MIPDGHLTGEQMRAFILAVVMANTRQIIPREDLPEDEPPTTPARPRRLNPRYVLIVEDDRDIRELFAEELREAGYTVHTAANGKEALDVLDEQFYLPQREGKPPAVPSVILLDIFMPVMSGFLFFAELLRSKPHLAPPVSKVIVMSADHNITAFQDWALNTAGVEGADDAIPKPVSHTMLLEKVARAAGLP